MPASAPPPQNVGSQRLLDIAARGEVQDRALWYPTVTATNARGASTALVGSAQTISDSIIDYVDLGCELISIRGYDNYNDAVDYGRYVLPKVHGALRERQQSASKKNGSALHQIGDALKEKIEGLKLDSNTAKDDGKAVKADGLAAN